MTILPQGQTYPEDWRWLNKLYAKIKRRANKIYHWVYPDGIRGMKR